MIKSKAIRVHLAAAFSALLLVSFMVVRTSNAAFSDSISSGTQSVDAGTLVFSSATVANSDISITGVVPGFTDTVCYDVTYGGSVAPSALSLSASIAGTDGTDESALGITASADTGTTLDAYLTLTVKMGASGQTCSSLLDASGDLLGTLTSGTEYTTIFPGATLANWSTVDLDAAGWAPDGSSDGSRAFVFEFELPSDTGNPAQGDGVDSTFTWNANQ